jgi:hypothetical protein
MFTTLRINYGPVWLAVAMGVLAENPSVLAQNFHSEASSSEYQTFHARAE